MKKIVLTLALILSVAATGIAQERQEKRRESSEQLSVEQRDKLHLKKMTLDLDLTPAQQKEMATIIAEQSAKREAKMAERKDKKEDKKALTADQKFEMRNKMLDEKMEMKTRMKKVLNEEQMKKWEANQEKREDRMQKTRRQHRQKSGSEVK